MKRISWRRLRMEQFPNAGAKLKLHVNGKPVRTVYLDSAATTPQARFVGEVIENRAATHANVHRGASPFSQMTSRSFDRARESAYRFVRAEKKGNYVYFVNNNTDGLNLAAHIMHGVAGLTLVSEMEHHSNLLPHSERGKTVFFDSTKSGAVDFEGLEKKLKQHRGKVKLVAITAASNVTGFMPDIHRAARLAHQYGARILVDAAQIAAHAPIDVKPNRSKSHIDFLVVGGHKMYNPNGSGFLLAPAALGDAAKPYKPGGGTILSVQKGKVVFSKGPERHEGGTPDIPAVLGLRAAMVGLRRVGLNNIRSHEVKLIRTALRGLRKIRGVTVYGKFGEKSRTGVISFNVRGMDHERLAEEINKTGIQIRNGCFCAQPYVLKLLNVPKAQARKLAEAAENGKIVQKPGMVRVSFGVYTSTAEVKQFLAAIERIAKKARATV